MEHKLQDALIAKKITKEEVKKYNTTLCITNNHLNIKFGARSWDGVANKVISGCRQK